MCIFARFTLFIRGKATKKPFFWRDARLATKHTQQENKENKK